MSQRCLGCMEMFDDKYQVCPYCGYIVGTEVEEAIHMLPGTRFHDRYMIGRVLGFGGFGITYIAWDEKLEQKTAIKEYLPGEFSTRMPGQSMVTVFNGEKSEQFRDGMEKFLDEAKRLAKFQNEGGIVKVFDGFEENGTAYIVMEYLDGMTLKEYLTTKERMPQEDAVAMLMPVMKSLQTVHEQGLLHRDIAPDNIFITKKGEIKLIDFGASRFATTSHSRSLTVIIKPGYSPEEQYRSRGDQGTYTDVYALGATLYRMITGITPPDAMERRAKYENENKDILKAPHRLAKISIGKETAILNALNVRIEDRTPDVGTLIEELNADPPAKRRYGKIKKIDFYRWPLWMKAVLLSVLTGLSVFGGLLATGVISFKSNYSEQIIIPKNMVEVPNVEGMSASEAVNLIEDSSLVAVAQGSVESEYIEAGKILLQTPSGGAYLDINGQVYLSVSSGNEEITGPVDGKATVPFVMWDTKENAQEKFAKAGLGMPKIVEEYDENVEEGHVISQSIEAGQEVDEGTVVTLVISKGAKGFEMPNVVGMEQKKAQSELQGLGLQVTIEYQKNSSVKQGVVFDQSVEAGKEVRRGTEIVIVVSNSEVATQGVEIVEHQSDEIKKTGETQYTVEGSQKKTPLQRETTAPKTVGETTKKSEQVITSKQPITEHQTTTVKYQETTEIQETEKTSEKSDIVGKVTAARFYNSTIVGERAYALYRFDLVNNAIKYEIYKCDYSGEVLSRIDSLDWKKIGETTINEYRDYDIEDGKAFLVKIRAVDEFGKVGDWSEVFEQYSPQYSFQPDISIYNVTSDSVEVSWTPYPITHQLDGYRVEIIQLIGNTYEIVASKYDIPVNTLSCKISGLESGTKYQVRINANCEVVEYGKMQLYTVSQVISPRNPFDEDVTYPDEFITK